MLFLTLLIAAAAPQKLAALGFSHANVSDEVAKVAGEHFTQQLSKQGFDVTTEKDLAALIGIERQKQLLGCADTDSSCLTELTNALGVAAVVTGSLGRFGTRYTVNVKVTDAANGASLAVFSSEVGSEDELPATLSRGAADIADQLRPRRSLPLRAKVAMGVGYGAAGVLLAVSGMFFTAAATAQQRLRAPMGPDTVTAFRLVQEGNQQETIGYVLLGTGVLAALTTSVVVMAIGESVALSAGPGGVSVRGTW